MGGAVVVLSIDDSSGPKRAVRHVTRSLRDQPAFGSTLRERHAALIFDRTCSIPLAVQIVPGPFPVHNIKSHYPRANPSLP